MMAFVFFLLSLNSVSASSCQHLLEEIERSVGKSLFTIALDYDGTLVDTDSFLVRRIIPLTILDFWDALSVVGREKFRSFLERLELGEVKLPSSYTKEAWRQSEWDFPVEELPGGLSERMTLEIFWEQMSGHFRREISSMDRQPLPRLPQTEAFCVQASATFGNQVEWLVATARTTEIATPEQLQLESLFQSPVTVLSRGKKRGRNSYQNARHKAGQLGDYRSTRGSRVRVLLENDLINLQTAAQKIEGLICILVEEERLSGL